MQGQEARRKEHLAGPSANEKHTIMLFGRP